MKQKLKPLACTCHVHIKGYTVLKNWRIVLKKAIFRIYFVLQESYNFPVRKPRFSCVHHNCDCKHYPTSYFYARFLPFLTISWGRKEKQNFQPWEVLRFQNNDPLKAEVKTELQYTRRLWWLFLDHACLLVSLIFKFLLFFFLLFTVFSYSVFIFHNLLQSIYSNVKCAYLIFIVTSAFH